MGNAVTTKAAIVTSPRKRSLLFFLQTLSLEKGGLRTVAEQLFEMFPERIGTKSMIKHRIRAGASLNDAQVKTISTELYGIGVDYCICDTEQERAEWRARRAEELGKEPHDADYYLDKCCNVDALAEFLIDLCVNPHLLIQETGSETDESTRQAEQQLFIEKHGRESYGERCRPAAFKFFHDICGALFEFQTRYTSAAADSFAKTNVAKKVMATLDACLHARRMVLIEGESDSGKSTSAEAWCRMHKGHARFVRLQGVTNKTVFFRAIARALGLASSYMRTAKEMQARVEDMLQRSGLMLVLDESQYHFAQSERIYSRPEIVDWIYTALCNYGVPVALIASPLFSARLHQAERQTIWNSSQFKRRIYRYEVLPPKPTRNDIELVVKHHLPDADSAAQKYLAGYAATATHPFTAVADTLADAAQIAEAANRARVTLKDLMEAVSTYRTGSELAKRQAFDEPRGKGNRKRAAQPAQAGRSDSAEEMQEIAIEETFTGRRPVAAPETHPSEHQRSAEFQDA